MRSLLTATALIALCAAPAFAPGLGQTTFRSAISPT